MSNKDYKQIILDGLLKKYNNRYAKNITTNRRIILKPKEVYKDYDRNNADILFVSCKYSAYRKIFA